MGLSREIKTMDDLFVHTLRDIYYAEQIAKSLPKMIDKATNPQLKRALESHLGETKNHAGRVEKVFKMHGIDAKGVDCPAFADGACDQIDRFERRMDSKELGTIRPIFDASGSNLTFESRNGFPLDSTRASLAYAIRGFHHSQARRSPLSVRARAGS